MTLNHETVTASGALVGCRCSRGNGSSTCSARGQRKYNAHQCLPQWIWANPFLCISVSPFMQGTSRAPFISHPYYSHQGKVARAQSSWLISHSCYHHPETLSLQGLLTKHLWNAWTHGWIHKKENHRKATFPGRVSTLSPVSTQKSKFYTELQNNNCHLLSSAGWEAQTYTDPSQLFSRRRLRNEGSEKFSCPCHVHSITAGAHFARVVGPPRPHPWYSCFMYLFSYLFI